jgi:hypothetical protein
MYAASEIPDAIGWTSGGGSILIECKSSKSDFNVDQHKTSRRLPQYGMGNRRFYLVPPDILNHVLESCPDGWGVLVCYKTRVEFRSKGEFVKDVNKVKEMGLLISSLRRIAGEKSPLQGLNVKCYSIINEQLYTVATLGIESLMVE